MKLLLRWTLGILVFASLPAAAAAQNQSTGAIAGVVKDTSGAVLPGVTVEAASPVLIEKVRTVITDGEGTYRIVDLRPGTYTVTFSLGGFSGVKREGIALTSGFTANVNADLKVGDVSETITVTGASPVVDVQNARTQQVMSREILDSAPTGRQNTYSFAAMTVGVRVAGGQAQDVGGTVGEIGGAPSYHGQNGTDSRYKIDGMDYNTFHGVGGGASRLYHPNQMGLSETNLGLGGQGAENETAGVQLNYVPKEGGNRFSGLGQAVYSNSHFISDNLTDEIRARGLTDTGGVERYWDNGLSIGGPIRKDKAWFLVAPHYWGGLTRLPGTYYNATQHTPFYTPDLNNPGITDLYDRDLAARVTLQLTQNNKVTVSHNEQRSCFCAFSASSAAAPEFAASLYYTTRLTQGTWTAPHGNRLLFQGGLSYGFNNLDTRPTGDVLPTDISTVDQGLGISYRAAANPSFASGSLYAEGNQSNPLVGRFSASYVTGSHSFKVGMTFTEGWHDQKGDINQDLQYIFLNRTPISITQYTLPFNEQIRVHSQGLYAQDQWTLKRLTLNLGVRFDHFTSVVKAQEIPAGPFVPARSYPEVSDIPNFKDISPRISAAYDLFGNGKTAVKGTFGRYVGGLAAGFAESNNPALRAVIQASRTWNDANGNYVPDCVLTNFAQNGECSAINNSLFGSTVPGTSYTDDVREGWGNRGYSYQTSIALQQELRPGLSTTVGYFRTTYGNILANTNTRVTPADYTIFCVTAPLDSRLPGGGGNQVCGNYDVNPAKFGQVSNVVDQATSINADVPTRVFNGVDMSVTGRFGKGALVTGGVSIGRIVQDDCSYNSIPGVLAAGNGFVVDGGDVVAPVAVHPLSEPYCHVTTPWSQSTQYKVNGVLPLWYGFEAGYVFQNLPGAAQLANLTYTNAQIAPIIGRNLSSGANGTFVVPILAPNTSFEDRLTQVDLRLTRVFKFGTLGRIKPALDLYNLLNASTITSVNNTYGARWLVPLRIMNGRYVKIGVQVDF